jgi:L-ascorbate metabolism protein UlaG (beta-lactamase superfamily)
MEATMKITRYPQSCLKLEHEGRAVLVDIGTMATAQYKLADFGDIDAVLFTHSHADHFDVKVLPELAANGATIYGNSNVAQSAQDTKVEVIDPGEELVVAGFKLKTYHMEHCLMTDGSKAGIPNTGFVVNGQLLLPGDSTEDVGIKAEVVAVPIFGPDISLHDAYKLTQATRATKVIPVHYDVASMNPGIFKMLGARGLTAEVIILENGASAQI